MVVITRKAERDKSKLLHIQNANCVAIRVGLSQERVVYRCVLPRENQSLDSFV